MWRRRYHFKSTTSDWSKSSNYQDFWRYINVIFVYSYRREAESANRPAKKGGKKGGGKGSRKAVGKKPKGHQGQRAPGKKGQAGRKRRWKALPL